MRISVPKAVLVRAIVATLSLVWIPVARANPGLFDDRIIVGQSAALKERAAELGLGMRDGTLAAFEETNAAGGSFKAVDRLTIADTGRQESQPNVDFPKP